MTDWLTVSRRVHPTIVSKTALSVFSAALVSLSLWAGPSLAGDPFRSTNARPISDSTEKVFKDFFEEGNYQKAEADLKQADPNEPMTPAMYASLAYIRYQGMKDAGQRAAYLDEFRRAAEQTQSVAQAMVGKDPLRGNLYLAVGHFLKAAHAVLQDGTVKGTPQGLSEIQQAFKYLDEADKKDPNDPELNLVRGYIELMMALNLPFSSPAQAITRLDKYAAPRYLADRGIAIGYRDLNQNDKALVAVNRALQATPTTQSFFT